MALYSKLFSLVADGKINNGTILHDILDGMNLNELELNELQRMIDCKDEMIIEEALKFTFLCLIVEKSLDPKTLKLSKENLIEIFKNILPKFKKYLKYINENNEMNHKVKVIDVGDKIDLLL